MTARRCPVGCAAKGHAKIFIDISNSKDRNINLAKILQKPETSEFLDIWKTWFIIFHDIS
jgi:hypothetical protein